MDGFGEVPFGLMAHRQDGLGGRGMSGIGKPFAQGDEVCIENGLLVPTSTSAGKKKGFTTSEPCVLSGGHV